MRFLIQLLHLKIIEMAVRYYAVAKGHTPGIYNTWEECKLQVHGYANAKFKKFPSKAEAESFIQQYSKSSLPSSTTSKANYKTVPNQVSYTPKRMVSSEIEDHTSISRPSKQRKIQLLDDLPTSSQKSSFNTDPDGYTNVFTDGACSSNGFKNATAGIGVWFGDNHPLNLSEPVIGRPTNNMAEIQAVTVAALQAKKAGIKKLQINTDSQFLISCITKWMKNWKSNGWKTASNKPVINKTELLKMEKALSALDVRWNHVNGHVGIYGNEMADKLARAGCQRYRDVN